MSEKFYVLVRTITPESAAFELHEVALALVVAFRVAKMFYGKTTMKEGLLIKQVK